MLQTAPKVGSLVRVRPHAYDPTTYPKRARYNGQMGLVVGYVDTLAIVRFLATGDELFFGISRLETADAAEGG